MSKNYKMLHLANHIHHNLFQDDILIGGFYNWHRVFHYPNNFVCWDIHTPKKIKEDKPDVILLGLSRPEMLSFLPDDINRYAHYGIPILNDPMNVERRPFGKHWGHDSDIRYKELGKRLSEIMETRPLKVFHIDYAVQMWKEIDAFSPGFLKHALEQADVLFTADILQGHAVYAMLGGTKDIYLVPHPTNTVPLKKIGLAVESKENIIRTLVHRYDNEWLMPFVANMPLRDVGEAYKNIMVLLDGNPQFATHLKSLGVDLIEMGCRHSEWVHRLAETAIALDSYHWFSNYGRTAVECACLRTPLVGTNCTNLQSVLFPEITAKKGHVDEQAEMLLRLIHDKPFYVETQKYAFDKVDEYGYDRSRERFIDMIEGRMEPRWKAGRYDEYRRGVSPTLTIVDDFDDDIGEECEKNNQSVGEPPDPSLKRIVTEGKNPNKKRKKKKKNKKKGHK
jgi:hypothetical protein